MGELESLLEIIQDVSAGKYSNDIMSLSGPDTPEPVRMIAESHGTGAKWDAGCVEALSRYLANPDKAGCFVGSAIAQA